MQSRPIGSDAYHGSSAPPTVGLSRQSAHVAALRAAVVLAATTGLAYGLDRVGLSESIVVMVFVLGVLAVTLLTGRTLGIVSAVVGVMAFNFLFTAPRFTLVVNDSTYLITFAVMLIVTLTTSALTGRIQQQADAVRQRERRTQALYQMSRSLLRHTGRTEVLRNALEQLRQVLSAEVCFYVANDTVEMSDPMLPESAGTDARVFAEPAQMRLAADVAAGRERARTALDAPAESTLLHVPLTGSASVHGVLGVLLHGMNPDHVADQADLIETFAAQISLALDREQLAEEHEQARLDAEGERLKSNLLRSISHDLRTPLSGISGSASALMGTAHEPDADTRRELARSIHEESTWLSRVVENLLNLTRLEGRMVQPSRTREVVDDLVASTVEHCRMRLEGHALRTSLPAEVVTAPMDGSLMEQVLVNLIDNAIKHTPSDTEIRLEVERQQNSVVFVVSDNGPGFEPSVMPHVFDRFSSGPGGTDSRRGVGLGLAICKTIVEAHGGTIAAGNAAQGGAEIRVEIPVGEEDA